MSTVLLSNYAVIRLKNSQPLKEKSHKVNNKGTTVTNSKASETYESDSAIKNDRKQTWLRLNNVQSELLGQFRLTGDRAMESQIQNGAPLRTSERWCGVAHCPLCSDWYLCFLFK